MQAMKSNRMIASGDTVKGAKKQENEDRFLIKAIDNTGLLLAVSDGMGGSPAGEKAADDVICSLTSLENEGDEKDNSLLLITAINQAEAVIRKRVDSSPQLEGMGATATAALITGQMMWWVHIGDSRIYLMRQGALQQITRDHSFLQDLIDGGDISAAEAVVHPMAHMLDQCVGCMDTGVDSGSFSLLPGDILLICTDGIYRSLSIANIEGILATAVSATDCVEQLLKSSPQAGFSDDATVVVAFV